MFPFFVILQNIRNNLNAFENTKDEKKGKRKKGRIKGKIILLSKMGAADVTNSTEPKGKKSFFAIRFPFSFLGFFFSPRNIRKMEDQERSGN